MLRVSSGQDPHPVTMVGREGPLAGEAIGKVFTSSLISPGEANSKALCFYKGRVYIGALLSNPGISTLESPQGDDVDAVFEGGC